MTTPLHARQRGPLSWALLLLAVLLLGSRSIQAQTVDTYSFSASAGTFTALPAAATAVTTISSDDAVTSAIPIGFGFVFDGNSYTQVYASSNGTLSFNAAAPASGLDSYTNNLSSAVASLRPMAAPYWDDLTGSGGTAAYQTTGTAGGRVFTFQWLNWSTLSGSGGPFSFQVQLVEGTNEVRFVYRQGATVVSAATASIGLAGLGSGSGTFLSLSNTSNSPGVSSTISTNALTSAPATGQIYSFTPPVPSACPAPRSLNSTASNNSALVTFTTTNTPSGPFTIQYGPAGFNPALASSPTNFYITITTTQLLAILTGLTAQTTYQFYVTQNCGGTAGNSTRSTAGTFTTEPNPAANDNCAQAIALPVAATCASPTNGTVFGATPPSPALTTSCTSSSANDVWYSFVANGASQTITFVPQFAAVMDVRSGTCATSTSIFCTAAAAGASSVTNVGGLTLGQTYFLRVYASGATQPAALSSTFTLCVVTGPPVPANDNCAGAVPLTIGTLCVAPVSGTIVAASQSLAPTPGCTATTANDVWYSFVATGATQTITFAPQFAAILNVRSGACAATTSISCAATAAGATSNANLTGLTSGQTYFLRVYASGTAQPSPTASTFLLCASGAPTATRAQADTDALLVYPNPSTTGQLTLRLAAPAGKGQATLLNALGQTVRSQPLNGAAEQTLPTRNLAPGLYTLRVTAGEQVLTRKVVLE